MISTLPFLKNTVPFQQSALSPQTWPFDVSLLPETAYLVGGSVRDALLGRQADYLDLDFVLAENAIATARIIAKHYNAGFVVLDADHQIARVVFPRATVDFAQQVGNSIQADLYRRDFTINAIAYHPQSETLLDPVNGYADLQGHTLKMIAAQNLSEDPLRLLRAYRQAAQLGFSLAPATQEAIRHLAHLLGTVAAERVRGELDCLLSFAAGTPLLQQAWQDQVFQTWLPHISQEQVTALKHIDDTVANLQEHWPLYADLLTTWIKEKSVPGLHRSWIKATKLSQLLSSQSDVAETELVTLKYSRSEQQAVMGILRGWAYLQQRLPDDLTRRQQYFLFKLAGNSFIGVGLLGLSHGLPEALMNPLIEHFLDPMDPIAHPQALVTGRDLMQALQLKPGPQIGQLLEDIQVAQAEGYITTQAEAIQWAKKHLMLSSELPS